MAHAEAAAAGLSPTTDRPQVWRPSAAGWAARIGILAGLLIVLIWATSAVSGVWADRFSLAAIYAIIGLSLNIVMGYLGQVSLGHHAFVGLAAFASAFMVTTKGQSFPVGVLTACALGGLSAGLLGLVALRIKGLYLALITLTYGFVAVNSLFEIPALTGGGQGLDAPKPSLFSSDAGYAYLCYGLLALVIFIDWRMMKTKVGRGILAIKESEAVASSYGINVTAYKVLAFVVSGVFAGLAGSLIAHQTTVVSASQFQFSIALLWVLMVVVGGLGNRIGVVIGSAFFALFTYLVELIGPLEHFLTDTFERAPQEFEGVIGALLALLTIILHPGGISDQVAPLVRWFSGKKFSFHAEDEHGSGPAPAEKKRGGLLKKLGIGKDDAAASNGEPVTPAAGAAASTQTRSLADALEHAAAARHEDGAGNGNPEPPAETTEIPAATGDETAQIPAAKAKPKKKTTRKRTSKVSHDDADGEA
jgi:branched-chain amino acid transport system permease protein